MSTQWNALNVSVIHLTNGHTIRAEVNGLDLEGTSGFAFAQSREIAVRRIDNMDEWTEVRWISRQEEAR